MNRVERGRWKLVIRYVDGLEAIARRDEDRRVAGERGDVPSSRAALSSRRSEVVPTATIRPPRARASFKAAAVSRRHGAPFGMHAVVLGDRPP